MQNKIRDSIFAALLIVLTIVIYCQYKANVSLKIQINSQYLITIKTLEKDALDVNRYIKNEKINNDKLVGFKNTFVEYRYASTQVKGALYLDTYVENIIYNIDNLIKANNDNLENEIIISENKILKSTNILIQSFKMLSEKSKLNNIYTILNDPDSFYQKYLGANLKAIN